MVFVLRIDLESDKGIREGLPKILDLLKKYNLKASFYLTIGGESGIYNILKYRKKLPKREGLKIFSIFEKIRIILFPKDFVKENRKILMRILSEGHELGLHGWKHRKWSRGLEGININEDISKSIIKFKKIFDKNPISFAAPAFQTNKKVLQVLENNKIKVISDLQGTKKAKLKDFNIINVPITILGPEKTPFIENEVINRSSDEQIIKKIKKELIQKDLASIYIHGLYECREKIDLLESLFSWINKNNIKTKTIQEVAGIK